VREAAARKRGALHERPFEKGNNSHDRRSVTEDGRLKILKDNVKGSAGAPVTPKAKMKKYELGKWTQSSGESTAVNARSPPSKRKKRNNSGVNRTGRNDMASFRNANIAKGSRGRAVV